MSDEAAEGARRNGSGPQPARPVVLCILDGWGLSPAQEANAVALARTPTFDQLMSARPNATLKTSGEDVGLIAGQMGNSEVGHTNLGAGRVVWMDLPKIDRAIEDGALAERPALQAHIEALKTSGGVCHLMGLMSSGGVHAHRRHMAALAKIVSAAGVPVRLHLFLDGRDTPPKSALAELEAFRSDLADATNVEIATVSGRFYAMDRDTRWERVKRAYESVCLAQGDAASTAEEAVAAAYERGETDEFVSPTVLPGAEQMQDGDGVLMANFRADRARELLSALADPTFDGFPRGTIAFADLCGMVEYSEAHNAYLSSIFPQEPIDRTLGAWMAELGRTQMRIAETEKYPHVTFFFNGGAESPNTGEDRHMAPSPKVRTYDLQPEMSSAEVTESLTTAIESDRYDLIVANYANPDMVGHTGDLDAAIAAVEAVDAGLSAVCAAVARVGGAMLVTADHGNCEQMVDPETGGPHTAHTTNPVPVVLVHDGAEGRGLALREGGRLADVAPTLLELMDAPQPEEMTGRSLLIRARVDGDE